MGLQTYIAFLRGINVSGKNKIPMESLRALCKALGFVKVKTYIQSGNVVFQSPPKETSQLEQLLNTGIQKEFGFEVPAIVKTVDEIVEVMELNPFTDITELTKNTIYFVLLNGISKGELTQKLITESFVNEEFKLGNNCVYLKCNIGYAKAKLNNNSIERKLKVKATTRNYRTMSQVLKMANSMFV